MTTAFTFIRWQQSQLPTNANAPNDQDAHPANFHLAPLKQISFPAHVKDTWDARVTHAGRDATLQLRRLA